MNASTPTTLLIERFEDLLDRGLRQVIESDSSLEILARDVEHARLDATLSARRPNVAILDVDALSSLAEIRRFGEKFPNTQLVLIVSRATTAECVQALAFGACAFLGRDTQARDVLSAIHLASRGLQLIPRAVRDSVEQPPAGPQLLTAREAQLIPMLQQGRSNAEIAVLLQIGVETVRTHVRNIYRKLGVSSRHELTALPSRDKPAEADETSLPARRAKAGAEAWRRQRSSARR